MKTLPDLSLHLRKIDHLWSKCSILPNQRCRSVLLQLRDQGRRLACRFSRIRVAQENRPADPQLLHFADQRSALLAKFGRCTARTSNHPSGCFKCVKDHGTFGVFKRRALLLHQGHSLNQRIALWTACFLTVEVLSLEIIVCGLHEIRPGILRSVKNLSRRWS